VSAARPPSRAADVVVAAGVAAVVSGAPSTLVTFATGGDALQATRAAGSLLLGPDADRRALVVAGGVVHAVLSLGWTAVLGALLPRRHAVVAGAVAGAAIAAFDLGVVGRRFPMVRALPVAPQVADHVAFGACVGAVLSACDRRRRDRCRRRRRGR
jgi:hypothetical protein